MASYPILTPPDLVNINIEEHPSQFQFQENSLYYKEEFDKLEGKMSYIPNSVANMQYGAIVTSAQQQQQQHHLPQIPPPSYQQQIASQQQQHQPQPPPPQQSHMTMLKRKMTLDLNTAKRARNTLFSTGMTPTTADVLSSPDLHKLDLPTPELDRLAMSTTNPSVLQTPTSIQAFFPKNVTEEQELFVQGFEQHLKQLHDQSNNTSSSFSQDHDDNSSTASSYNSASKPGAGVGSYHDFSNVIIKEEPQGLDDDDSDDSSSGGDETSGGETGGISTKNISPIDMANQEKIKLERKRQRNRLAASKCRRKKLERISKLEDKVKQLKGENNELGNVLVKLRDSVQVLKSQVMDHVQAGCAIVINSGTGSGAGNFS